jgi:hypothetical protein
MLLQALLAVAAGMLGYNAGKSEAIAAEGGRTYKHYAAGDDTRTRHPGSAADTRARSPGSRRTNTCRDPAKIAELPAGTLLKPPGCGVAVNVWLHARAARRSATWVAVSNPGRGDDAE